MLNSKCTVGIALSIRIEPQPLAPSSSSSNVRGREQEQVEAASQSNARRSPRAQRCGSFPLDIRCTARQMKYQLERSDLDEMMWAQIWHVWTWIWVATAVNWDSVLLLAHRREKSPTGVGLARRRFIKWQARLDLDSLPGRPDTSLC